MLADIIDHSAKLADLRARQAVIQQELEAAQQKFSHELATMIANKQGLSTLVTIANGILAEQRIYITVRRFPKPRQKKVIQKGA